MKPKYLLILLAGLFAGNALTGQVFPGLRQAEVRCGADRTAEWTALVEGKRLGVVANPTSRIGTVHLVDSLVRLGIRVGKVFAPEHGFRGEAEDGATIVGGRDPLTGIQVVSLYGDHKKPVPDDFSDIDLMLFDIQDVGARFYTFISTLHLVMEACAESGVQLILFDRPNPNGFYIDGPVLDTAFRSFVGMHPVPVVHGLTIGEYARMINGEGWLKGGVRCDLTVIPCSGYDHSTEYILPVRPSPNLPNQVSVYLYPSLCLFEGTVVSIGRGTPFPFQVYGHPGLRGDFAFTPVSVPGSSLRPLHENKVCRGEDLRTAWKGKLAEDPGIRLVWLQGAWRGLGGGPDFFTGYFSKLAGSNELRDQILSGKSEEEIRESWKPGLTAFQRIRMKYLLYPDSKWCGVYGR